MRIETLSLKGLLKFTEPVTLDFRDLPSGLIAITGENGAGKTTILEAMVAVIHRRFASRDGELYDYATGRDSFIEADIAIDGRGVFRTRVNVDGPKRTSDAALQRLGTTGPVTLSNGKVSDFDVHVAEYFPARSLLLASAFAAQNKTGSFISLDKKDRKALFMRLLSIERYQTMSDTARQAATLVEQTRGRLSAVRDELARGTARAVLDELDRLANQLQAEGGSAEADRVELRQAIAVLEERLAIVQDQVTAHAAATQRVRTIEGQIARSKADRDGLYRQRETTYRTRIDEVSRLKADREAERIATDTLIANNKRLIDNREAVQAAIAAVDQANEVLTDLRARERQVRQALEAAADGARRCDKNLAGFSETRRELTRAEEGAETLKTVPFGEKCGAASCRFLTNALAAEAQILPLRDTLRSEAAEYQLLTGFQARMAEYMATLQSLTHDITHHETTVVAQSKTAALREKVAAADARIEELERKAVEQEVAADRRDKDAFDRYEAAMADITSRQEQALEASAALHEELTAAEADLDTSAEGNRQAVVLQGQLAETRAKWDLTTGVLARVESGRVELERRRAEMAERLTRVADLAGTIDTLTDDLLAWQFLGKGLGRDGLPVLEIDAAGPTISAYTNELLTACFGARFTVELVTQRAKADGKGYVDDFSVQVFDNQAGGDARDIADLSGGEQVIVAEALMNAISIYVNTTSPIPVRTCWRDETTGALDPENTQRYLAMLRKVQELGGFHHMFFISQNPDASALADAQIQVAGGRAAIVLPPFATAEAA